MSARGGAVDRLDDAAEAVREPRPIAQQVVLVVLLFLAAGVFSWF